MLEPWIILQISYVRLGNAAQPNLIKMAKLHKLVSTGTQVRVPTLVRALGLFYPIDRLLSRTRGRHLVFEHTKVAYPQKIHKNW